MAATHSRTRRLESRYHREAGVFLIELRLTGLRQLFNSLDPSPFPDKDLNDEAERYIVETVREFPAGTQLKLVLYLPPEEAARAVAESTLTESLNGYFDYRRQATQRELIEKLRQGRLSLLIGLAFLFSCMVAVNLAETLADGLAKELLQEGLLIGGWVAMWRPIEIFLYDWWPINRRRRIYRTLSTMPVETRPDPGAVARGPRG